MGRLVAKPHALLCNRLFCTNLRRLVDRRKRATMALNKKLWSSHEKFLDNSIKTLYNIIIDNLNLKSGESKMATANYTEQQTKEMVAKYEAAPTKDTVEAIAEQFGKNTRSVIAKLSREGVYKAQPRTTKSGEPVVLKQELVDSIQVHFGTELPSLVKASKADLQKIVDFIS